MTDFHKLAIYRSGRAWANAWDLFRPHRLEAVAFAKLLWLWWCVLNAGGFGCVIFLFCSSNTHGLLSATSMRSCFIYLYTGNEARPRRRSDRGRFFLKDKMPLHNGTVCCSQKKYLFITKPSLAFRQKDSSQGGRVLPTGKKPIYAGVRTGLHFFNVCLSVVCCLSAFFTLSLIARDVRGRFLQIRDQ